MSMYRVSPGTALRYRKVQVPKIAIATAFLAKRTNSCFVVAILRGELSYTYCDFVFSQMFRGSLGYLFLVKERFI